MRPAGRVTRHCSLPLTTNVCPVDLRSMRGAHPAQRAAVLSLPHALLRRRVPGAALERGRSQRPLQEDQRGGAEKANADAKYKAALKDAVEECAEATKGQTCFICTEGAVRRHTANEGLVTGYCACRGTAGFVHISCLVEQAKLAVADDMSPWEKWSRWNTCRLCHQPIRGKVKCAIGWACWRPTRTGPTWTGRAVRSRPS